MCSFMHNRSIQKNKVCEARKNLVQRVWKKKWCDGLTSLFHVTLLLVSAARWKQPPNIAVDWTQSHSLTFQTTPAKVSCRSCMVLAPKILLSIISAAWSHDHATSASDWNWTCKFVMLHSFQAAITGALSPNQVCFTIVPYSSFSIALMRQLPRPSSEPPRNLITVRTSTVDSRDRNMNGPQR